MPMFVLSQSFPLYAGRLTGGNTSQQKVDLASAALRVSFSDTRGFESHDQSCAVAFAARAKQDSMDSGASASKYREAGDSRILCRGAVGLDRRKGCPMSESAQIVNALKRYLKSRGLTYRDIAKQVGLSEASIKRVF